MTDEHLLGELGDVLEDKLAVEDLASGRYVYRKALKTGRGTVLEL